MLRVREAFTSLSMTVCAGILRLRPFGAGGVAEGVALGVDLAAQGFEDVVGHLGKYFDDFGIEWGSSPSMDLLASFRESSGGAVGAVGDDGIEGVSNGEDARAQGNFISLEA